MTIRTIEIKKNGKYVETYKSENEKDNLHSLASDLAAKYIGKARYVKSIRRTQNYNGTQTYTVYYDNDSRAVYLTDIY